MSVSAAALLVDRFQSRWTEVLLVAADGARLTYGDVWSNAMRIADDWRRAGVRSGDAVALLLPNSPGFVCSYIACFVGGFVAAPVNPELPQGDIQQILDMLAPRLVLRDAPLLAGSTAAHATLSCATPDDQACAVFFTSGTTGLPKGVRHTLSTLVGNVASFNRMMGLGPQLCMYHVLPMAYMAGFLNTLLSPMIAGGRVVLGPRFTAQSALSFWEKPLQELANAMWITPSIAAALCRASRDAEAARNAAASMRVLCGTAPLQDAVRERFAAQFGVPLQESYGTSELLLIAAQGRDDASSARDVGTLLPELQTRVRPNPEGQPELTFKSPFAFAGYLTAEGVVAPETFDGFHGTGDIGEIAAGRLRITGRIKDLIIRGGVNVAPAALENALTGLPSVGDVAVIGIPHEFWGEAIVVCIEAGGDREMAIAEVRERCRERLGRMQQPDRVEVVDQLPRSTTGKVQKNKLRALFAR